MYCTCVRGAVWQLILAVQGTEVHYASVESEPVLDLFYLIRESVRRRGNHRGRIFGAFAAPLVIRRLTVGG